MGLVRKSTGGSGYDATAYNMIMSGVSAAAMTSGWVLADRREVFDRLCFNLDEVTVAQKTPALAFDDATDAAAIAASSVLVDFINTESSLLEVMRASTELVDFATSGNPDLSTYAYASKSLSITSEETNVASCLISPDGDKFYVVGASGDGIDQYTLGTPGEINTATHDGFVALFSGPEAMCASFDGVYFYASDAAGAMKQYVAVTPWNFLTAVDTGNTFDPTTPTVVRGIAMSRDGAKFYVLDSSSNLYQFAVPVPFDISSIVSAAEATLSISAVGSGVEDVFFGSFGESFYIVGRTDPEIHQFDLAPGDDIDLASYVRSFDVSAQSTTPHGVTANFDGTRIFVAEPGSDTIYQYDGSAETAGRYLIHTP